MLKPLVSGLCLALLALPGALAQPPGGWLAAADQAYRERQYAEAVRIVEEGLPVLEANAGKDTSYVELLVLGGRAWYQLQDRLRAEQAMQEALSLREQLQGRAHTKYIKEAFNLATIYRNSGYPEKYQRGKALLWDTYNALKEQGPSRPEDEGRLVRGLGNYLIEGGEYDALESVCQNYLISVKGREGSYSQDVVQIRFNLARAVYSQGLYRYAATLFEENLAEARQVFGPAHELSARPLRALATCHLYLGLYEQSEAYFREALDVYEKLYGRQHLNYYLLLSDFAKLYLELEWPEAEPLLLESLHQLDSLTKGNPAWVEETRYNLGIYYLKAGDYARAEPYLSEASSYFCTALGPSNALCIQSIGHLTFLDSGWKGDYGVAKARLLPLLEELREKQDPVYALALNRMGRICFQAGEWAEARRYSLEALALYRKHYGPHFDKETFLLSRLARLAFRQGNGREGLAYFQELLAAAQWRTEMAFSIASGLERQRIAESIRQEALADFGPLLYQHPEWREALAPALLEWSLFSKSLLERAQLKIQQLGRQGDAEAAGIYQEWLAARERLAQWHTRSRIDYPQQKEKLEELQQQVNVLEKELSRRLAGFDSWVAARPTRWQQLRDGLQQGEALVDILKLPSGEAAQSPYYYAAIILKGPEARAPEVVVFPQGAALEGRYYRQYFLDVSSRNAALEVSAEPHAAFWAPLEPFLKGARTIHLAPDGVFHKLNPSALRRQDGSYLLDHYDIRLLSQAGAAWPRRDAGKPLVKKALLLANPAFSEKTARINPDGPTLSPLPFAEQEMAAIGQLLEQEGWEVHSLSGVAATESALKQAGPPGVLHLATHGHFRERSRYGGDREELGEAPYAMLRSVLFLAAPSRAEQEDGLLSAYEVMNMGLEGTELAVLSACRSGQGELADGEGIYGFQRALRIAGARTALLSLWDVDDQATAEWMTAFYQNWRSGLSKFEAYQATQRAMREKYNLPFYWAGFIYSGE